MDTLEGRSLSSLSSLAISYPDNGSSDTARKKYKAKLLRDFPETLRADFMIFKDEERKTDLLFYTEHPNDWHTALSSAIKDLKMAGNKAMRQLFLETTPKFNINLYNNGTVMIQGSTHRLEQFERNFDRTTVSVQRIQECLSMLEMEITEFKESKLQETDSVQQLRLELEKLKKESSSKLGELETSVTNLHKKNQRLNDELTNLKEEMRQKDAAIHNLTEQITSLTTEQHLCQTTARGSQTESSPSNTTTTSPITSQTKPSPPATQPAPPQPSQQQPAPNTPPLHPQPPKTAILIDSNGKFLNHRRLFPTHSVGKFWCPTTDNALKLLCQSTLNTPQNILIHTGTNDLRSKGEKVAESLKKVAEKAHRLFPQANIAISTLLPRRDYPGGLINKINQSITSDCATLPNVTIIHHPALSCDHLYDLVHLDQEGVRLFAKDLREALYRDLPTLQPRRPPAHPHHQYSAGYRRSHHRQSRALGWPSRTQPSRTQPSTAQPSTAQLSTAQPSRTQPSTAQPSTAQPSRTQPSTAQPSRTQPSTAQPNPAQPWVPQQLTYPVHPLTTT
ncbi:hypothetical protein SKAU_G00170290 [Synaphobranchus kaupii]|uniref:SGNH hydrolase-type esterase domain-containing protein n=1 Tax=Synaphobranchus kaupii TaxID=118154 RepID=A0A9Q1FKQ5_SYNKA|nr:hypothetical protein SKAU_G00170290 [Synaphobranchus kaupii]